MPHGRHSRHPHAQQSHLGVGENYVKALSTFKPGFERTFAECVQDIDRLHNRPLAVVMGGESIYVLPAGGGDVA